MPTNAVHTAAQERLWKKAKKLAAAQGHALDYGYTMGIYQRMIGEDASKSLGLTSPPQMAWGHVPGQLPRGVRSQAQLEAREAERLLAAPARGWSIDRATERPVLSPRQVVADLGLSLARANVLALEVDQLTTTGAADELTFRQSWSGAIGGEAEPVVRVELARRGLALWRSRVKERTIVRNQPRLTVPVDNPEPAVPTPADLLGAEDKAGSEGGGSESGWGRMPEGEDVAPVVPVAAPAPQPRLVLEKAGPYVGPKGGLWADPKHTIHWDPKVHGKGAAGGQADLFAEKPKAEPKLEVAAEMLPGLKDLREQAVGTTIETADAAAQKVAEDRWVFTFKTRKTPSGAQTVTVGEARQVKAMFVAEWTAAHRPPESAKARAKREQAAMKQALQDDPVREPPPGVKPPELVIAHAPAPALTVPAALAAEAPPETQPGTVEYEHNLKLMAALRHVQLKGASQATWIGLQALTGLGEGDLKAAAGRRGLREVSTVWGPGVQVARGGKQKGVYHKPWAEAAAAVAAAETPPAPPAPQLPVAESKEAVTPRPRNYDALVKWGTGYGIDPVENFVVALGAVGEKFLDTQAEQALGLTGSDLWVRHDAIRKVSRLSTEGVKQINALTDDQLNAWVARLRAVAEQPAKKSLRLVVPRDPLEKSAPRGGQYAKRTPRPGGGYRYYYSEKGYERATGHVDGQQAAERHLQGRVRGLLERAGAQGVHPSRLGELVRRHGRKQVAAVLKGMGCRMVKGRLCARR